MNISKAIAPDCVRLRLKATSKTGIIEELITVLAGTGKVPHPKKALRAVLDREKKMSTGMRDGVALPHARFDEVERLVAAVGLVPEGTDFDSMDKQLSHIFVLTLSPANRAAPYIQFLGDMNRLLILESQRKQILAAKTPEELYAILTAEPPEPDDEEE